MGRYGSISEGGLGSVAATERVSGFLRGVYGWMCAGLALTALVAFYVAGTNWATTLAQNHWLLFALFIAQIGVVITLSAGASRLSPGIATLLFLGYSALTGLTFSSLLLLYTGESIATTFMVPSLRRSFERRPLLLGLCRLDGASSTFLPPP